MQKEIGFNTTQEQVEATFGKQLETKQCVVVGYHTNETTLRGGVPFITLRLAQSTGNSVDADFTGIGKRIRSTIQNISVPKAETLGIIADNKVVLGAVLDESFQIQERHSHAPAYAGQQERRYGGGEREGLPILVDGKLTYKHTSLVKGEPDDDIWAGDEMPEMATNSQRIEDAVAEAVAQ